MQFYVMQLEVGDPNETWCSYLQPENEGEAPRCPQCNGIIGAISTLPPYGIELKVHGRGLGDLAFCPGNGIVVSGRFRESWAQSKLRGLDFVPVDRIRVRPARLGKRPLTYLHVMPQRFGTRVDLSRSLIEYRRPFSCMTCLDAGVDTIRGFSIDESSWTGEDLFIAWGMPGTIIVTDRVRQLRDDHDLKNVTLTPVEKFVWDPLNRWTPVDYSRDEPPPELEEVVDNDASLN